MNLSRSLAFAVLSTSFVISCATPVPEQRSPFLGAEPEVGSILRSAPRTLRLYFDQLPDVSRSEVTLTGPNGPLNLRGLHTMGANDLMMEVFDQTPAGAYTVQWRTFLTDDPVQYEGSYDFTVQASSL